MVYCTLYTDIESLGGNSIVNTTACYYLNHICMRVYVHVCIYSSSLHTRVEVSVVIEIVLLPHSSHETSVPSSPRTTAYCTIPSLCTHTGY